LTGYKYVVVFKGSTGNMVTSTLIPIEVFKNETTGYWLVTFGGGDARCKYSSNTSVKIYHTAPDGTAILYGLK
jgi:hypothetical protein